MALNIPISLNIENLAEVTAQVAKMTGAAGGAGAGGAARGPGAIGSLFGGEGGAGGSTAKGLGQIAKQLPGAGVLGDMGAAFKQGGIIGVGMAGVAGILGFVKQIMESSKVFQGIAGSFFKIFGAMADLFLLPFLPLAMRGMQMLLQHLPKFQEWGQKTADWIGDFIKGWSNDGFAETLARKLGPLFMEGMNKIEQRLSLGLVGEKDYEYSASANEGRGGTVEIARPEEPEEPQESWLSKWNKNPLEGTGGGTVKAFGKGLFQALGGHYLSGGQFSPTIKRGDQVAGLGGIEEGVGGIMDSMEVSLARQAEKVKDYATQFQQKEVGAGGMLGVWDDEVLRGSIPDTWDSISGMYRKMDDELADEARNAALLSGRVAFPEIDPTLGLNKIADALGGAINNMTLGDFVLDSSVADEIENCFIMANQCVNTKFTSLADLVEGGVEAVQFGVGGQVMDLDSINNLVAQAQGLGGAVAAQAEQVAAKVAQLVYEMSSEDIPLTIDPAVLSNEIAALQKATEEKVMTVAADISAATANVDSIVAQWSGNMYDIGGSEFYDYSAEGMQFGGLGAAFGEATGRAQGMYDRIRGFRPKIKRKKQRKSPLDLAWEGAGLNEGLWEDSTYEQIEGTSGVRVTEESGFNFASDIETLEAYDNQFDEGQAAIAEAAAEVAEAAAAAPAPAWDTGTGRTAEQDAMVEAFYDSRPDPDPVVHSTDYGGSDFYDYSGEGMQFGGAGGGRRRGVQNMSTSVMNISINTRASVQDILSDLRRVQHMDDASFFNSVS